MPINIFNTFDDPSASTGTTQAFGVNDTDQIVGSYSNASGSHGFLESGGMYTTLDDPLATTGTTAQGINATGQTVGFYNTTNGPHGLLFTGGTSPPPHDPRAAPPTP